MTTYQHTSNSNRSRSTVRLRLASNEHINAFTGSDVSNYSGNIINGIADSYTNEPERVYVTQRPSIAVTQDASETVTKDKGRGIYYWKGITYFVNDDTIYRGTYGVPCSFYSTSLTSGTEKVYFQEWDSANESYLFIINPEGNQVFIITGTDSTIAIDVDDIINVSPTGTGAPFHASDTYDFSGIPTPANDSSYELCHGAVNLDKYLFLGLKNGTIWSSNVDNWLTWNALDFITAERENDKLLYIEKTKDHIAAFGERSVELFYDAGNQTGSPLSVRLDTAFRIGIVSGQSSWVDGDDVYFLGIKPTGGFSVFTLQSVQLSEKPNPSLDSYLRHGRTETSLYTVGSGFATGGHTYFILTLFNDYFEPQKSIVFDAYSGLWYEWYTTLLNQKQFPLISWTIRTPEVPVTANGIMSNGDIFELNDNFVPVDVTVNDYYFLEDYLLDSSVAGDYMEGYVLALVTNNVKMSVILDNFEALSSELKFMHVLKYAGSSTKGNQGLLIEWTDDDVNWYSGMINIKERTQINRLGSFVRRKFRISYSGDEQIRAEALDVTYTQGG